jgi:hypothetical protein
MRNEAKNKPKLFRLEAKKTWFFACFASKRKNGNQKRNETELREKIKAKLNKTEKS